MKKAISMILALVMVLSLTTGALAANVKNFTDVKDTDWYADAVEYVVGANLFSGTSTTTFTPNGTMTRAMFVTVLGRMTGLEASQTPDNGKFKDIAYDTYYGPYVVWASENGIVNGTSETTFSPNNSITREQAAVIIHRYLIATGVTMPTSGNPAAAFTDMASVGSYAKDAVDAMRLSGFIAGSDGKYNPQGNLTRAQAATILMRINYYIENGKTYEAPKDEKPLPPAAASFTLNAYEYTYETSEYDDDTSGALVGQIKVTDNMFSDMAIVPGVMPYTISCSDSSIVQVTSSGKIHSPVMLKDGEADKVAYITVTNTSDNTSATVTVTISNSSNSWYVFDNAYINAYAAEAHRLVNEARNSENLPSVSYYTDAQPVINLRSEELATHYSHVSASLPTWGTEYNVVLSGAENIQRGSAYVVTDNEQLKVNVSPTTMAKNVINSWLGSSGHKANIMLSYADYTAIGLYISENGNAYAAQFIGRMQ